MKKLLAITIIILVIHGTNAISDIVNLEHDMQNLKTKFPTITFTWDKSRETIKRIEGKNIKIANNINKDNVLNSISTFLNNYPEMFQTNASSYKMISCTEH